MGPLQVDYGWLAFPGAYWYAESEPVHSFYFAVARLHEVDPPKQLD
jgi:hypothetical protein